MRRVQLEILERSTRRLAEATITNGIALRNSAFHHLAYEYATSALSLHVNNKSIKIANYFLYE